MRYFFGVLFFKRNNITPPSNRVLASEIVLDGVILIPVARKRYLRVVSRRS